MKKNNIVIYFSELLLLIYIIVFKIYILESFSKYIDIANLMFFCVLCFFTYKLLGFSKKRGNLSYNAGQTIIIILIIYYILIYIFGLFFGFLKNSYSLTFISVLKNILFALLFYIPKELYRYMIVSKKNVRKFLPILIVTLLLAFLDIVMGINGYDFSTNKGIFELIEILILPKLVISCFLTYIAYNFNYKTSILFLVIFDLPKYFLPLIPDLGNFISSITTIVLIFIMYYKLSVQKEYYEERKIPKIKKRKQYKIFILLVPMLLLVGLVSGLFKYHLFAIGSNSMLPVFEKGDAVIIEKLKDEEYDEIKEGDIIAFKFNGQIIVHRIIDISKEGEKLLIKTKGDNNKEKDGWTVNNEMIYGKVTIIIPYIGLPSVELSELMNKR